MDEENTLCLDHPESHLALPEIQPWLMRLADATEEGRCQAIIATHHPELINLLAAHSGYWLERESGGPTRVRKIGDQDSSGLPLSELIARGCCMVDRYTQVVVLCEDFTHFNFVRRYLVERGVEGRRIRGKVNPSGRGAGTQYVVTNYPVEVQAIRSKSYLRAA